MTPSRLQVQIRKRQSDKPHLLAFIFLICKFFFYNMRLPLFWNMHHKASPQNKTLVSLYMNVLRHLPENVTLSLIFYCLCIGLSFVAWWNLDAGRGSSLWFLKELFDLQGYKAWWDSHNLCSRLRQSKSKSRTCCRRDARTQLTKELLATYGLGHKPPQVQVIF